MVFVSQVLISFIRAFMTSIVVNLLHEEVLSWDTLNLKSSVNDELSSGCFLDVKESISQFGILHSVYI